MRFKFVSQRQRNSLPRRRVPVFTGNPLEKVPQNVLDRSDDKVWFIPHHSVYHHKKPDKIRVVFNCSTQFHGASLNNELFQRPDLTNSLVGVLIRFRQDPVEVMGDVQSMFHQVRIPEEDRDLLRFLWWPKGDLIKKLEEYRMTIHLFGAASSPSCANFAMRQNVEDHKHKHTEKERLLWRPQDCGTRFH